MFAWMKRQQPRVQSWTEPDTPIVHHSAEAGKYGPLYKYLETRFANTVVLTFAEIEDILGFALPDAARRREDWWTSPDPQQPRPGFSDAWILAHRTAKPNLLALTVVFER